MDTFCLGLKLSLVIELCVLELLAQLAVPLAQGSVLGPLIFLIYVNFTVTNINCYYTIFADDIKIYFASEKSIISSGVQDMQANIELLVSSGEFWA